MFVKKDYGSIENRTQTPSTWIWLKINAEEGPIRLICLLSIRAPVPQKFEHIVPSPFKIRNISTSGMLYSPFFFHNHRHLHNLRYLPNDEWSSQRVAIFYQSSQNSNQAPTDTHSPPFRRQYHAGGSFVILYDGVLFGRTKGI